MNEPTEMLKAKCILKLMENSKICDVISKELLVLIALINEQGLRVSDIHSLLGGNKSWVSNLCFRLNTAGLILRTEDGREVYYNLTERGAEVAIKALELVNSLLKTEDFKYIITEDTFILDRNAVMGKKFYEFGKLFYPFYSHFGSLLYNSSFKYLFFIGYDRKGKPFVLNIPLNRIQTMELGFDEFYKRRYSPRIKPLIIDYCLSEDATKVDRIYLFINYRVIGRLTQNARWLKILTGAPAEDQEQQESPLVESKKDMIQPVEIESYEGLE